MAKKTKRFLAFLCSICPFCVARRAFPNSAYARFMRGVEKNCPACDAWRQLRDASGGAKPESPEHDPDEDRPRE